MVAGNNNTGRRTGLLRYSSSGPSAAACPPAGRLLSVRAGDGRQRRDGHHPAFGHQGRVQPGRHAQGREGKTAVPFRRGAVPGRRHGNRPRTAPRPDTRERGKLPVRRNGYARSRNGTSCRPVQHPVVAAAVAAVPAVGTVQPAADSVPVQPEPPKRRGFNNIRLVKEEERNVIRAFVHSTQTVTVGSTLKMQIAENLPHR